MFKFQTKHVHSVRVSLAPETLSLLQLLLPEEQPEESVARAVESCHVVPLLQLLYEQAHSEDWVSNPTTETTVSRDWYAALHRLKTLLASLSVRVFFPVDLEHPAVDVTHTVEDAGASGHGIARVLCPGLYCERTETFLAPARVAAMVPAQTEAVA